MDPGEIRSIRGSLSRAAFSRLLGVTPLTVLRWELPADNKEARRPRAKMVEALRKLAADGVGARSLEDARSDEDDEDDESSEPAEKIRSTSSLPNDLPGFAIDEAKVRPILARLGNVEWEQAEHELLGLLAGAELGTPEGRTLATLGVVQVQLLARLDVRAAVASLLPILDEAARGTLPRSVAARAHVMGALLFGAPDTRLFDPGRVNVHFARAEPLLESDDDELRVLLATARITSARFVGPHVVERAYKWVASSLDRASSHFAKCIGAEIRSMHAMLAGDSVAAARLGEEALERAERLGFIPIVVAILAERAHYALRGAYTPPQILAITARARAKAKHLPAGEPLLRVLAAECEALGRLGKLAESEAVLHEALELAKHSSVPLYSLMGAASRLYGTTDRLDELEKVGQLLESTSAAGHLVFRSALVEMHLLYFRAIAAVAAGRLQEAVANAEQACRLIDSFGGIGAAYIVHDAQFFLAFATVLTADPEATRVAVRKMEALLEERPSLWHSAMLQRTIARNYSVEGRLAEARQHLEKGLATFELLEDIVQARQTKLDLALATLVEGAPDAESRVARAQADLAALGLVRVELAPKASPQPVPQWQAQTTAERFSLAIERLAVRGLPLDALRRELMAVLGDLFPARRAFVEPNADAPTEVAPVFEIACGGRARLRFGVDGTLGAEERAILRTLATVASMAQSVDRSAARVDSEPDVDPRLPGFLAVAPATRELKREIAQLSRSNATILVTGESGSGKEVVARAVHDLSARSEKPYVAFNCASVPRDLFEGQLFGYKKGAFTGASSDSPGVIRAAAGGTLFLDEIGELPLDVQPKLLRFLENGEIFPLGEQKPRRVDVRVLAATHRDLGRLVREGTFREDLYYRLNVVPLQIPPLRERREDVVALARMFVTRLAPDGTEPPQLSSDAVSALEAHGWPGNVRELRNVIERAMAYAPVPSVLGAEHLRLVRR